jgi:hypothetical protein
MRRIHIALPVIGLLLSGGGALAATGTSAASPGTATTTQSPLSSNSAAGHAQPSPEGGLAGRGTTATTSGKTSASGTTGGKFTNQSEAAKACGSAANVVWANPGTKVFHVQGDQYFGHTKRGAFMCKSTATAEGFHPSGQTAAHKG